MDAFYWIAGTVVAGVGIATIRLGLKTVIVCLGAAFCCHCSEKQK